MPEMRNEDGKLALPGVRLPGDPVSEKEKSPALYYLGRMISGIKEMRVGRDAHIPPRTPAVWDDAKSGGGAMRASLPTRPTRHTRTHAPDVPMSDTRAGCIKRGNIRPCCRGGACPSRGCATMPAAKKCGEFTEFTALLLCGKLNDRLQRRIRAGSRRNA